MFKYLWLRHWCVPGFLAFWAALASYALLIRFGRDNALVRWLGERGQTVGMWAALCCVVLPFLYVGDKLWARVEAREDRLRRSRD